MGGGGTRGGLHIGALRAIQEIQGDLEFPDGIYGASVGGILATAVAFRVDLATLRSVYDKYFTLSSFLPDATVDHVLTTFERRGLFQIDPLINLVLKVFDECGIDLRGKRICDAPQKLFLIASNMTTGVTTLLTGKVPILDAIRCTTAIPLVFEPQVLYGQVYLDPGVHLRCIRTVVPEEALVVHISGQCGIITPQSTLPEILFACYSGRLNQYYGPNMVRMRNVKGGLLDELTQADRDYLAKEGYSQTLAFFAQRLAKECLE
jgi:predicted acylesterase/phospholipase RssA